MVELEGLRKLLDADFVMSHDVATKLSDIAYKVKAEYGDFIALHISGSTVCGGAVAKSLVYGLDPQKAISDIDYGVILSSQFPPSHRKLLHGNITHKLESVGLKPCTAVNANNVYLVADDSYNMAQRIVSCGESPARLAADLLMPFGVIFPFSERPALQTMVNGCLEELDQIDSQLQQKLKSEMNRLMRERRVIKEKHVRDTAVRNQLNSQRVLPADSF